MTHRNCRGTIELDGDAYRCQKCKRGFKCVGAEHYLDDVKVREERATER